MNDECNVCLIEYLYDYVNANIIVALYQFAVIGSCAVDYYGTVHQDIPCDYQERADTLFVAMFLIDVC